eukprot:10528108-Alexandrium_andersonii.AAC.1
MAIGVSIHGFVTKMAAHGFSQQPMVHVRIKLILGCAEQATAWCTACRAQCDASCAQADLVQH